MTMLVETLGISKEEIGCGKLEVSLLSDPVTWTPLQYACTLGDPDLVSEIIDADPKAVNALGNTKYAYSPLHLAVHFEHEAIVKLLLNAPQSTKVNAVDDQIGIAPLHLAILQENKTIVKLLLEDINIQHLESKNGTSPIDLAKELGFSDIHALLVDHGTRTSSREQLANWLASIGLVAYARNFFDEGFDDANFLLNLGELDDQTLDALHIEKAGHRAKLRRLYRLREFLHIESEDESNAESEEGKSDSSSSEEDSSDEEESDSVASGSDDDSS